MSKPQVIEYEGKPTHVVLTIEDYRRLEEQAEELTDIRAFDDALASRYESFPDMVAQRLIEGNHPVRVFREHWGLSLAQLASRTGLSKSYIAKIESRGGGSVNAFSSIAGALGVSVDDLIE